MLDSETKRRIDNARDILVGKVPDPKSQVEQITIALIYKFMDDMDAESEELGGKRKFFTGDFARYGWAKLMRAGLGGFETLNLYAEGIARMPENPGIPALFRDIFKNAYLPYRDPETLKSFLKIIDDFSYDHSERLGDAFEYLLSVLGSQGDAGQFRTPRHFIDFIVEILNPQKTETMLDVACGTAGFIISTYKHILRMNTDANGQLTLTPEEKGRLAKNLRGYDISPDMVRLSLVNLYLHGFADPHIVEYDTLTSEERWNEYADIQMANPPFMSPKGGIKPHKRFTIQAKRSEVLFVDYIASHLTPTGRAGIIVPEGIIFQSQTAYKQLRKLLIEEYLVAVISLPAGVFNPYSGVKTSILIFDRTLAKQSSTIGFFKINNDGFGLGAQRRSIDKNDLPQVKAEIALYLKAVRNQQPISELQLTNGFVVSKEKIAANGDYNLSGERYRDGGDKGAKFPFFTIGDISDEIRAGFASGESSKDTIGVPHIRPMNITEKGQFTWEGLKRIAEHEFIGKEDFTLRVDDVLFNNTNSKELVGKTCLIEQPIRGGYSNHMTRIRVKSAICMPRYLALLLHSAWQKGYFLERANKWVGQAGINAKSLSEFEIPLPPLEVQREIVAEIEGYQKVIDGARAVLDNYRPHIPIDPNWPMVELGEVCKAILTGPFGTSLHQSDYVPHGIPVINPQNIVDGAISNDGVKMVSSDTRDRLKEFTVRENDIVIGRRGEMGRCAVVTAEMNGWLCGTGSFVIRLKAECDVRFSFFQIASPKVKAYLEEQAIGVTMKNLNQGILSAIQIPLPPIETQQHIVAEIEAEQALVAANRELVTRMEKKIQAAIARVWGEEHTV